MSSDLGVCYMYREPLPEAPLTLAIAPQRQLEGTAATWETSAPAPTGNPNKAIVAVEATLALPAGVEEVPTPDKRRRLMEIDAGVRCGMPPGTVPWEARVVCNAAEDPLELRLRALQAECSRERAALDTWDANALCLREGSQGSPAMEVRGNPGSTKKRTIDELLHETGRLLRSAEVATEMQKELVAGAFRYPCQ